MVDNKHICNKLNKIEQQKNHYIEISKTRHVAITMVHSAMSDYKTLQIISSSVLTCI